MSRKSALLSGALLVAAVVTGPTARADYFYNFSPVTSPTVLSDHSGMGITLANQAQVGPINSNQNSNVVATTLSTFITTAETRWTCVLPMPSKKALKAKVVAIEVTPRKRQAR